MSDFKAPRVSEAVISQVLATLNDYTPDARGRTAKDVAFILNMTQSHMHVALNELRERGQAFDIKATASLWYKGKRPEGLATPIKPATDLYLGKTEQKVLDILDSSRWMLLNELGFKAKLAQSTVGRAVRTLESRGFATIADAGGHRIKVRLAGPKTGQLFPAPLLDKATPAAKQPQKSIDDQIADAEKQLQILKIQKESTEANKRTALAQDPIVQKLIAEALAKAEKKEDSSNVIHHNSTSAS